MKSFKQSFSVLLLIFAASCHLVYSQNNNWDYEQYPRLDVDFEHLDGQIHIRENGVIEGDVTYDITFRVEGVDTLKLDAAGLDISGVEVEGSSREFTVEADHLVIVLGESFGSSQTVPLRIRYAADPQFSIHRSDLNVLWTSLLPGAVKHWLPVADHPRVGFTTKIVFTHPSGQTMIAGGRRESNDIVNVEEETTEFVSDTPIPAISLTWSLGQFFEIGRSGGDPGNSPDIRFYSEVQESGDGDLFETASEALQQVQDYLPAEYPYDALTFVLLEDGQWETKFYGSGIVYLFRNRGELERQIQTGVIAQWAGVFLREEQWNDAGAILALQAFLSEKIFGGSSGLSAGNTYEEEGAAPYDPFSAKRLSGWQHFFSDAEQSRFINHLEQSVGSVFGGSGAGSILSWQHLADKIYNETGQPYFNPFNPGDAGFSFATVPAEGNTPAEYNVEMEWNEQENTIRLNFESAGPAVEELVTVEATEITFSDETTTELTFTGRSDAVVLNVPPGIQNLKLRVTDPEEIDLSEDKPFLFWIYQLRNDEDEGRRADAASALARFSDNPDLQLVLTDQLRVEESPEVYAELLRSFSAITRGAAGTDQFFMDRISSDQPSGVQIAAVEALALFGGNERIAGRLRTTATQTGNREVRRAAIRSLYEVSSPEDFRPVAESLITNEAVLRDVPFILRLLAESGETEAAVEQAATFLAGEFPFEVRRDILEVVLQYDDSRDGWAERLPGLLSDRDSRIRYAAAEALEKLTPEQRRELIADRFPEEYDERVRRQLSEFR